MYASRLDTFSQVREEVHDFARASEAAGGVAPMQIGAVKRVRRARTSGAKEKVSSCNLRRAEMTQVACRGAERQAMCYCQMSGHIKGDCRNRQRDIKKANNGAMIEGIPNVASDSHDHVFVVTDRPRLVQARQMEEASCSLEHHFRVMPEKLCILNPRRLQISSECTPTEVGHHDSSVPDGVSQTADVAGRWSGLRGGALKKEEQDGVDGTGERFLTGSESLER